MFHNKIAIKVNSEKKSLGPFPLPLPCLVLVHGSACSCMVPNFGRQLPNMAFSSITYFARMGIQRGSIIYVYIHGINLCTL